MTTGMMSHDVAAHVYASFRVALQVARDSMEGAEFGSYGSYGFEVREFGRRSASCDGATMWKAAGVAVLDADLVRVGYTTLYFTWVPSRARLLLAQGVASAEGQVPVTSTFDNGEVLALRISTPDDPAGVSAVSEALHLRRSRVAAGFAGLHLRSDLFPVDMRLVLPELATAVTG